MIGKKGKIEIDKMFGLILGIATLVGIMIYFLSVYYSGGLAEVYGWFTKGNVISAKEAIVLKEAIQCSYYRCIFGCEDRRIQDTENFKCKTDFCSGKTGKTCGKDNSIRASVSESQGERISKKSLDESTEGISGYKFKVSDTENCEDRGNVNGLYVDKSIILDSVEGTCEVVLAPHPCLSNILIQPGEHIVWTSQLTLTTGGNVVVCGG